MIPPDTAQRGRAGHRLHPRRGRRTAAGADHPGAGQEPRAYALGVRPVSDLIDTPNWFSFIVALLAGVVGVVSLTEARSSTLIGVFISVTTIPAASDTGVSLAFGSDSEAWGSVLQLLLNVTVLTAVAIAGLPVQRAIWRRAARRAARPVRIVG